MRYPFIKFIRKYLRCRFDSSSNQAIMNLKQTYQKYKSNLFLYGSSYLENIRTNLIDHYDLDPKKLKNNESTKHFDTKVLNNFVYNPLSGNYFFPIHWQY